MGIEVFVEQRIQVSATRFRVPDVCIVAGEEPADQIFHQPPFIIIEVLSPDDTLVRMQSRIDDYLNFGVPHVWVVDPGSRRAWVYTRQGSRAVADGVLRATNPDVTLPLAEVFGEIDAG